MNPRSAFAKVPAVTLGFWIVKILATTLGETGGDTVTMTWLGETTSHANPYGYLIGTGIFLSILVVLIAVQIAAKGFHPFLYWASIVASTTAGTTMADFADRSLGIGYWGGSSLLFGCVIASLAVWYFVEGTVSVQTVNRPRVETFYWITITFSQTLGTALGDWVAAAPGEDPPGMGLGYEAGAAVFGCALLVVAALHFWTAISRVFLFWAAFILTRPLGATVGDFLDKPLSHGGLALSRPMASALIAAVIVVLVQIVPQRPGRHPGDSSAASAGS